MQRKRRHNEQESRETKQRPETRGPGLVNPQRLFDKHRERENRRQHQQSNRMFPAAQGQRLRDYGRKPEHGQRGDQPGRRQLPPGNRQRGFERRSAPLTRPSSPQYDVENDKERGIGRAGGLQQNEGPYHGRCQSHVGRVFPGKFAFE